MTMSSSGLADAAARQGSLPPKTPVQEMHAHDVAKRKEMLQLKAQANKFEHEFERNFSNKVCERLLSIEGRPPQ